jgi:hypothetical protein
MKKLFILLLILLASLCSWAQNVELPPIIIEIEDTVFLKCMRSESYFPIKRNSRGQNVTLIFPANSTANTIVLFHDKDYYRQLRGLDLEKRAVREDAIVGGGFDVKLNLDLTLLEDGNYIAHYGSCSFNGAMKISLITK